MYRALVTQGQNNTEYVLPIILGRNCAAPSCSCTDESCDIACNRSNTPGKLHFVGVIILRLLAEKEKQVSPNNLTGFLFRSAFPCFYQTVILHEYSSFTVRCLADGVNVFLFQNVIQIHKGTRSVVWDRTQCCSVNVFK